MTFIDAPKNWASITIIKPLLCNHADFIRARHDKDGEEEGLGDGDDERDTDPGLPYCVGSTTLRTYGVRLEDDVFVEVGVKDGRRDGPGTLRYWFSPGLLPLC